MKKEHIKQDNLIQAALSEFSIKSFDSSSLNTIIKKAGSCKGTFYHYFPSKEALYFTLVERTIALRREEMETLPLLQEGEGFFNTLEKQALFSINFLNHHPDYYRFSLRILAETNPYILKKLQEKIGDIVWINTEYHLERAIRRGEVTSRLPLNLLTRLLPQILALFEKITDLSDAERDFNRIKEEFEAYFNFIKRGLMP